MSTQADVGRLPKWGLSDLFPATDAPEIGAVLEACRAEAQRLQDAYAGKLAQLDGNAFGQAIAAYESFQEAIGRLLSFANFHHSAALDDPEAGKFAQTVQERVNDILTQTLFFTLELNCIDEETLSAKLAAPESARNAPWIRDRRVWRPHQLSDDLEKLLHDKWITGSTAWSRLFEETIAGLRFPVNGARLTCEEALHRLSDPVREFRHDAAKTLGSVLGENARTFALILNTLIKDKEIEDRWRGFVRPISSRNLGNHVEDEVVKALLTAVCDSFSRLSHRYYGLKARWLGLDVLEHWDRNAPLPESDDRTIPWAEARDTVLAAYGAFSPTLAVLGQRFFDGGWIDAQVRPGKAGGAFAHPTVPSVHPYILLSYQGKTRDVMTLVHELGHGIHTLLAAEQGYLMTNAPLTLCETASVFGEHLTFQALLKAETDVGCKRVMLAWKVEDMLNTVVRQTAFCGFETRLHDERRNGEIWLEVQAESLGPAFRFDDEYRYFWAYISHFVQAPFYVYAYAFGDCLVNALYASYQEAPEGFEEKYLTMLRSGGHLCHRELLGPFGLDASDPVFWAQGLGVIWAYIDELEAALQ